MVQYNQYKFRLCRFLNRFIFSEEQKKTLKLRVSCGIFSLFLSKICIPLHYSWSNKTPRSSKRILNVDLQMYLICPRIQIFFYYILESTNLRTYYVDHSAVIRRWRNADLHVRAKEWWHKRHAYTSIQ